MVTYQNKLTSIKFINPFLANVFILQPPENKVFFCF